ncbi:MAG: DUF4410 domain-containing protein [Terrimicrobiaceae bacterium]|nr:DUF4410 domain-containing protein [Terrimicrobiaceae bacterium]
MRRAFLALFVVVLSGCSSTGVYDLRKSAGPVSRAPRTIFVEPFSVRTKALNLGERSASEKAALGREISRNLADRTALEIRRYAAPSQVLPVGRVPAVGTWLVRGEILKVDQGSRALRTGVGLGMGRTEFRTRVSVSEVRPDGLRKLLTFRTTGTSGLEPGAALGVATGAGAVQVAGGALMGSLAGVSSDVDRTAYEIAAVLSSYLSRNRLLSPDRTPLTPNMAGELPTTINPRRILPAPVRDQLGD